MNIIITTTAAEAAEIIRELEGKSVTVTTTTPDPWIDSMTESTAEESIEAETPQVEDIDDMPREPRRIKSWTQEEEDQVKIWIRRGMSVAEVAESLGRTPSSVRNKLLVLERERAVCGLDPIRPKKVSA